MFDETEKEVFFQNEKECIDQPIFKSKDEHGKPKNIYLFDLFQCSYDENDNFVFNPTSLMKEFSYAQLTLEVIEFYKDRIEGCTYYSTEISEEEFGKMIKAHPKNFNNSDNISAQTTAYFTEMVS